MDSLRIEPAAPGVTAAATATETGDGGTEEPAFAERRGAGLGDMASADLTPTPAAPAAPQDDDDYGPTAEAWEVTLSGVGSNGEDFDAGSFAVSGSVGYFLTQNFELSLRQSVTFADTDMTSSVWNGSTRVAADYHFDAGPVWPFIGANFGGVYGDSVKESFVAGPEAGVKWFIKEEVFVQAMAEYQFFFETGDEAEESFDDGLFAYSVGFGVLF